MQTLCAIKMGTPLHKCMEDHTSALVSPSLEPPTMPVLVCPIPERIDSRRSPISAAPYGKYKQNITYAFNL